MINLARVQIFDHLDDVITVKVLVRGIKVQMVTRWSNPGDHHSAKESLIIWLDHLDFVVLTRSFARSDDPDDQLPPHVREMTTWSDR